MCDTLVDIRGVLRAMSVLLEVLVEADWATSQKALATLDGVLCADAGLAAARARVGCACARRATLHLYVRHGRDFRRLSALAPLRCGRLRRCRMWHAALLRCCGFERFGLLPLAAASARTVSNNTNLFDSMPPSIRPCCASCTHCPGAGALEQRVLHHQCGLVSLVAHLPWYLSSIFTTGSASACTITKNSAYSAVLDAWMHACESA